MAGTAPTGSWRRSPSPQPNPAPRPAARRSSRGSATRPRPAGTGHLGLERAAPAREPVVPPCRTAPNMDRQLHRRFYLDWLRIAAFALLVLYHVGMYYVSWDWHINRRPAVTALEPLMLLTSPWRLSLLFLVSGIATAFLVARTRRMSADTGASRFMRSRSLRLLLPLAAGMLLVVPPQSYFEVMEKLPGGYGDGYLAFWSRYLTADDGFCTADGECLLLPTWNHLWFEIGRAHV